MFACLVEEGGSFSLWAAGDKEREAKRGRGEDGNNNNNNNKEEEGRSQIQKATEQQTLTLYSGIGDMSFGSVARKGQQRVGG